MLTEAPILSLPTNKKIPIGKQYIFSVLCVCSVSVICFLFTPYFTFEIVAFILLLTLSIIAMFFDIFPVLTAALLSALIWDYFFLIPRFNLRVGNAEDQILLSMYFVIAMLNAVLTSKIREVEKIAQKKEEKIQTVKLYNTMLNSLSHEFRTPLAAIIGASDNLLTQPNKLQESDKEKLLSEISIAALRLNQQVDNLLNMSRLESGFIQPKKGWCDMKEVITDVEARLSEYLKTHAFFYDVHENMPLFKLDYVLMEQIVYNLLLNACIYTDEDSTIQITVNYAFDILLIVIEDNGTGIPDEEKTKVFNKFYRLGHSRATGTGLGLSLVKGFTEAHNGTIELLDSESGGAKFVISIPIVEMLPKNFQNV